MKIFPNKKQDFILISQQSETIHRLERRTEKSQYLTSQLTDKSFRGIINGNEFKIISAAIGKGAFCVMSGRINSTDGFVTVEIHKFFKVLSSILMFLPIIGLILTDLASKDFLPIMILATILQVIGIRFLFIELGFRLLSRESLNRLRDVLDIEWKSN
jgi:hypothetical protein